MIKVIKWDGRKEPFQREKVERTLLRVGAPIEVAKKIARRIEEESYEGIKTEEVLTMAFEHLEKYEPTVSFKRDLRTALGEMPPIPDFEKYVRIVLGVHGYRVTPNRVMRGFCVEHGIDGIVRKGGETLYLEVKHHDDSHNYTPFDVSLAVKAKLDDLKKGFKAGKNEQPFDGARAREASPPSAGTSCTRTEAREAWSTTPSSAASDPRSREMRTCTFSDQS